MGPVARNESPPAAAPDSGLAAGRAGNAFSAARRESPPETDLPSPRMTAKTAAAAPLVLASEAAVLEIVDGFRTRTLPEPRWTHRASFLA